ncbi:MAG: M23 family metallopeptidase [Deltaproteobacteria bacterium]|nr:M23 family metallopeptidase [Deltaproteobacteria bacterium]
MRLLLAAVILRGCFPMVTPAPPPVAVAPAPIVRPVPDASWQHALRRVWAEGHVVRGPERMQWTEDEAVEAALALSRDRGRYDAFGAWVVGESVWDAPGGLTPGGRRALDHALRAALRHEAHLTLTWPILARHRTSSRFGPRIHPITGKPHVHTGIDLAVPTGTAIIAAQAGRVVAARESPSSGRTLILDHGGGLRTSYLHLDRFDVTVGDRVLAGQPIGASGATGRVTGPHLHFEVRVDGEDRDPASFSRAASAARGPVPRS